MQVGGTQVEIGPGYRVDPIVGVGVSMAVAEVVGMMTMVVRPMAQQPGADEVDHQAEHGHRDRLFVADRRRRHQPRQRRPGDAGSGGQ
jgi:hypothetical protein